MTRRFHILIVALSVTIFSACAHMQKEAEPLHLSAQYYDYLQADFESYVSVSRQWLRDNRNFISNDIEAELNMNAPFILEPEQASDKAALLVHGLGDSPYSFSDIAESLRKDGFSVFVLLLPGHGSKPGDLMLPHYEDWQRIVDHYAQHLKSRYGEVWLGGFSTGANLVTINAVEQGEVAGLLLFSPGFKTYSPFIESLAPIAAVFTDWGWRAEENNLARYRSSPINASIAYTDSAVRVRALLREQQVDIPAFIAISEADSVIDPYAIKAYFESNFVHQANQLVWYGESLKSEDKIHVHSMKRPDLRISTGSHMSPLFSSNNPYYGQSGAKKLCGNGFDSDDEQRCESGEETWFSAWGYEEEDKLFARLTWNPYYQEMEQQIRRMIRFK